MPFFTKKTELKQLQQDSAQLHQILAQTWNGQGIDLNQVISVLQTQKIGLEQQVAALQAQMQQQTAALTDLQNQEHELNASITALQNSYSDAVTLTEYGLANFPHPAENSIKLEEELAATRAQIKQMVRDKKAANATSNFSFNNSAAKGRKFVSDMAKMMLRAYNAEAENAILTVKAGNGQAAASRMERARTQVAKLGKMIDLEIAPKYHQLRLQELDLALRYQNAKKAEKEAEREEKARLREEAKAQQELQREREKLLKEREHYTNVISQLQAQGNSEELARLQAKVAELDGEIESVDFRAANQRAGYVYVISNIGSFGDRMVKIGMTRRLNPQDRVRELSDASVPFNFDIHALFFSADAVSIETQLHHQFARQRVNLVNPRREFFAVSPLDVKAALAVMPGVMVDFVEEPEAEQYRESIAMRSQSQN